MARYIDADELLRRLKELRDDCMDDGDEGSITDAIIEINDMLNAEVAVLPLDYHDRCMELEINRRFAAEEKVNEYPRVLDAIHGELTNAIGLVERLQNLSLAEKTSDKSDE